VIKAFI